MKHTFKFSLILVILLFVSCKKDTIDKPIDFQINHTGLSKPELPPDNKLTKEGVSLGRKLFYEKKLSENNLISCASCHNQKNAFADTNTFSIGTKGLPGKRQAMAIFNMAWNTNGFFWDGRADKLREQSLMPIKDHLEMNETIDNVISKLKQESSYLNMFKNTFENGLIDSLNISLALEQFMFTIVSNNSKYDRVKRGEDSYTELEQKGHDLFFTSFNSESSGKKGADCFSCHGGDNFENDLYMNNGLDYDIDQVDLGRQNVIDLPNLKAKFKVPSLRNIEVTQPYMHDGRFKTLLEVINHYDHGVKYSSTVNPSLISIQNVGLQLEEQEKLALVEFLKTLTDYKLLYNQEFSDPN